MKLTIEINCDNAAFEGDDCGPEVARILRRFANTFEDVGVHIGDEKKIFDINGNKVGYYEVTGDQ